MICQSAQLRLELSISSAFFEPGNILQTKSSPMEKMDSKKRKASEPEDEKAVEKKAKASPAK